mmetsp:Transcript_53506/g.48111  ORF Transcript_53506/g.48111 Transcript_53506/m.48111 type:complete len:158 (+) Transcript_53506:25-498(+)
MFSYINSIILKGESDNDQTQKQSNINNHNDKHINNKSHSEKTVKTDKHDESKGKLDPFMQRIMFPLYLDYESQNDKLLREKNVSKKSEISQSEQSNKSPMDHEKQISIDWKIFTPSNMPNINTEKENGEKSPNPDNINVRPRTNEDMLAFIETISSN